MTLEFAGAATPLTDADIAAHAAELGIEPAVIAAVAEVESAGAGFLPDGRPKILFEAHVFGRLTAHRYDASHPNISAPAWDRSLYGASGAHQYDRLAEAMKLDRPAALQSASWGKFQILGQNYSIAGFASVEAFVAAMCDGEAEHLDAFISFCRARDLLRYLATHDWRSFARVYNGPGQVDFYAQKIAEAYRRHHAAAAGVSQPVSAVTPRETIKRIQSDLGVVTDGVFGPRSRAAFDAVLKAAGQPGI